MCFSQQSSAPRDGITIWPPATLNKDPKRITPQKSVKLERRLKYDACLRDRLESAFSRSTSVCCHFDSSVNLSSNNTARL